MVPTIAIMLTPSSTSSGVYIPSAPVDMDFHHFDFREGVYDFILRMLLFLRISAFILQLPFRLLVLYKLRKAWAERDRGRDAMVFHLDQLTATLYWKANGYFSQILFAWIFITFTLTMIPYVDSPIASSVFWLTCLNSVIVVTNFSVSMIWLRQLLQNIPVGGVVGGASMDEIDENTSTRRFYIEDHLNSDPSAEIPLCSVCLAEYCNADELRSLPCSHEYHAKCIDIWLKKKRACPLCNQRIDVPLNTS